MTRAYLLILAASGARAQTTDVFDVASIKLNPPGIIGSQIQFLPGGRFVGTNVPLDNVIQRVYDMQDYQIIGPSWLPVNRFEIQARADPSATEDQLKRMVQNLLAERFKMKIHREARELPVYELVVGKNGVKIQPLKAEEIQKRAGRSGIGWNRDGLIANNVPLGALAQVLKGELGRPVLDKTGNIAGVSAEVNERYDFTVKYDQSLSRLEAGAAESSGSNDSSIFTALQEQLGLRLDSRKDPVEVLVVDSAERVPSGN